MKKQVLLIEDDDALRASLAQTLDLEGITVIQANGFAQARRTIRANFAGIILSDIRMPQKDGFDVLSYAQSVDAELPVVMLTGEADVPMALRAMKEGAYDFLEKPCASSTLLEILNRALQHRALVTHTRQIEQQIRRNDTAAVNFPGPSQVIRDLRSNLRQVAPQPLHVHLFGDAGAGKKLAAHTIHSLSPDRDAFVAFNLERPFETLEIPSGPANISLKNLDVAPPETQDKILQLSKNSSLRLITSSIKSVEQLKTAGFNESLLSALNPIEIHIPSLAQRKKDLPDLFESLVRQTCRAINADMPQIPQSIYAEVIAKNWEGNQPALRNFATTIAIGLNVHKPHVDDMTLAEQMDRFERLVLSETLKNNNGKAGEAALALGLPRKTFYDRLARYDLRPKDFKTH
jgi:two-component system, NtrC family, C4-dicarboxylate transport response regulator DctD